MKLGAFSISLAVKDIQASYDFYSKLGFEQVGGDISQNYLILRNADNVIGLFQGMFEGNVLTFNPGWDQQCNTLESFDDVRDILKHFKSQGIEMSHEAITGDSGPSSFALVDPDDNAILIDQHV